VITYLNAINRFDTNANISFWLSAYKDADSGIFKWLNSGNEFQYTNWITNHSIEFEKHVSIDAYYQSSTIGKWNSVEGDTVFSFRTQKVFCEIKY